MNKKQQLLADTFPADEGMQFSRNAAAYARRQRTIRRASVTAGLVASAAALLFTVNRSPSPASVIITPTPILEIISDQELMAQFKDQPAVFIKDTNGITQVILLAQE